MVHADHSHLCFTLMLHADGLNLPITMMGCFGPLLPQHLSTPWCPVQPNNSRHLKNVSPDREAPAFPPPSGAIRRERGRRRAGRRPTPAPAAAAHAARGRRDAPPLLCSRLRSSTLSGCNNDRDDSWKRERCSGERGYAGVPHLLAGFVSTQRRHRRLGWNKGIWDLPPVLKASYNIPLVGTGILIHCCIPRYTTAVFVYMGFFCVRRALLKYQTFLARGLPRLERCSSGSGRSSVGRPSSRRAPS